MALLECINESVIGIADIECDCIDNPQSIDITESDSGLFISDLISITSVEQLNDCRNTDVYKLLNKIRSVGLARFKQSLERIIKKKFRENYNSCIHKDRMNKTRYIPSNHTGYAWKGIEICSQNIHGATLEIEKIVTYFKGVGTKDLFVYSEDDLVNPLYQITVDVIDGKVISDIDDITLKLFSNCKTCDDMKYYIMYEVDALDNLDNECDCGCSSGRCAEYYADFNGVYWNTKADFEAGNTPNRKDGLCNGLEIYGEFKCDYSVEICEDPEIDYDNGLGMAIAVGVQYETALYLLETMGSHNSVLSGIFSHDKGLYNIFQDRLKENYSYLFDVMKDKHYNCLECRANVIHT